MASFQQADFDINHTPVLIKFLTSGLLVLEHESDINHLFAVKPNLEVLLRFHSE